MNIIGENMDYDVVIVGGGPAGATAASTIARKSIKVCLLERAKLPRRKLCAGGVPNNIFERYDLDNSLILNSIQDVRVYNSTEHQWTTHSDPEGVTVDRRTFDSYLLDRAKRNGAIVAEETRCFEIQRAERGTITLLVSTPKGKTEIGSSAVIFADGFNSLARRYMRGAITFNPTEIYIVSQCEIELPSRSSNEESLHFILDNDLLPAGLGYGWIFPKKRNFLVGVGMLLSHAERRRTVDLLDYFLTDYEPLRPILSSCRIKSSVKTSFIPIKQQPVLSDDGFLAIGDAAGQVSPKWGEGISYAMRAGELAAEILSDALSQNDLSRNALCSYDDKWNSLHGNSLLEERQMLDQLLLRSYSANHRVRAPRQFVQLFGNFAEIAYQFRSLRFPVYSANELIDQCGGAGRTFLFKGRVMQLKQSMGRLPEQLFPLISWKDAALKLGNYY